MSVAKLFTSLSIYAFSKNVYKYSYKCAIMHSTTQYNMNNFFSKIHGLKSKVCINWCIKMLHSQKRRLKKP